MNSQDDQVLKQLYKKGANEAPSAELDQEILEYAANKQSSKRGGSHFGGGWKVPLSLAASVVLVFALLVQLDQSPEQLEIPPIPSSESDMQTTTKNKSGAGDFNAPIDEISMPTDGIATETEELSGRAETQTPANAAQEKLEARKKLDQETVSQPTPTLEKSRQLDEYQRNNKLEQVPAEQPSVAAPSMKSKSEVKSSRPNRTLEPLQDSPRAILNEQPSTVQEGTYSTNGNTETMSRERSRKDFESDAQQEPMLHDDRAESKEDTDFAPIPVGDWLLMIEKLIARKDYAEAARQLEKFKQAHPKVNVEDLEAKLP